ncbi:MAG: hypothetical protein Q9192_006205, partial [Flavoplaca navasiana]
MSSSSTNPRSPHSRGPSSDNPPSPRCPSASPLSPSRSSGNRITQAQGVPGGRTHGSRSSSDHPRSPKSPVGSPISPNRSTKNGPTQAEGNSPSVRQPALPGGLHHTQESSQSSPYNTQPSPSPTSKHSPWESESSPRSTPNNAAESSPSERNLPLRSAGSRHANSPVERSSGSYRDHPTRGSPQAVPTLRTLGSPVPQESTINHDTDTKSSPLAPIRHVEKTNNNSGATSVVRDLTSNKKKRTSMVLSTSSRHTMDAESHLICYRLKASSKSLSVEETLQSLARVDFGASPSAILAGTDRVIVLADAQAGIEASKKLISEPSMQKIATFCWHDVLQFLHLANCPKEQCCKEGMLSFFKTLLGQKRPSIDFDAAEATSSPILEIRSGNEGIRKSSLAAKMLSFMKADPGNIQGLEHYIKGLRIGMEQFQDIQPPKDTAKVNTITGLARPDDSRNSQRPYPARVQKYGGGSKDVEFCYKPRGQRKGQYITVFDYFTKIKHKNVYHDDLPVINIGTRSKPTYIPPSCCDVIERREQEASVFSASDLMHMVSSGITNEANMPRWLSNGIVNDETRSSGLKLPLAENLKKCQITMICATLINPCRIKTAPAIVYSGEEKISPRAGTWTIDQTGLTSNNSNNSKARYKVAVLMFGPSRWVADEKITETLQSLHNQLGPFSIGLVNTSSPLKIALRDNKISPELEHEIKSNVLDMAKDNVAAVVFMLPCRSKPIYESIKRLCDLDLGIHSVCIDAHKLASADNDRGYCFQTALKLNMKMGGQNQRLDSQALPSISLRSTMVVGIDVMMPTPIANKRPKPVVLM